MHAGVDAKVLSILRDPGPATRSGVGSGFLCTENDDQTAENQTNLFAEYGIDPRDVLPWNAYPWYINAAPGSAQLDAGADVLCDLVDMLPDLRAVLLQGEHAQKAWGRVVNRRPSLVHDRMLTVASCVHPGGRGLLARTPEQRQARLDKQRQAYELVADTLKTPV